MKFFQSQVSALVAALLLAACGGGGAPESQPSSSATESAASAARRPFGALVSFGDSLSDVGTYTPATLAPGSDPPFFLGGRFTTNGTGNRIWVENIASALGLMVTPAEVGWGSTVTFCPAAAQGLRKTCTAYGQGGARVTSPNGIRHDLGALTVPLKTQIANHLAAYKRFKSDDLVLLWAGANDLLWELDTDPARNPDSFVVALFTVLAELQAGAITPEEAGVLIATAQAASEARMKQAAVELGGYIRDQILAKGGRRVVVLNLPDPVVTPEGAASAAQSPILGAAMTAFSDAFNDGLNESLSGLPVKRIDIRRFITDIVARPASYGITNASVPACSPEKIAIVTGGGVTDGFALFCNATADVRYNGIRDDADIQRWFFADGNHPTVGGYKLISDEVLRQLAACGWLKPLDRGGEL